MKTVVLQEPGRFTLTDTPEPPEPGPGEALVRVARIGVCGTDLHAFRGRQPFFTYPRILGHELGVEVVGVGPDTEAVQPGDRCAVRPYLDCGRCIACRRGKPNCCVRLQVLGVHVDGGMREWLVLPAANLHKSDRLAPEQLALVETLGIGAHAVERGDVQRGENVLVIGAGPIGLSVIPFAQLRGARVIVLDLNERRLEFCRRQFQPEQAVKAGPEALAQVEAACGGELPTAVFDATGNQQSMQQAFEFVASGGRLVLVGLVRADIAFRDPEFHRRELTLLATRNSTSREFAEIIERMENGTLDTRPWITHRAALDDVPQQFAAWTDPASGVIKAMIEG